MWRGNQGIYAKSIPISLKLRILRRSRVRNHITYIAHTRDEHNEPLKAQTKTRMNRSAVFAKVEVPP